MRDLRRRGARDRITVERDEPVGLEPSQQVGQDGRIDRQVGQLPQRDPSSRRALALAEPDEPEQDLARRVLPGRIEPAEDVLRATRQRSAEPTQAAVLVEAQLRARPAIEQLGEGVLEQGEAAGPIDRVGDELGQQRRLDRDPDPPRRLDDRRLQLARRHRDDVHDARQEGPRERRVEERPVVEVGPQREQRSDA